MVLWVLRRKYSYLYQFDKKSHAASKNNRHNKFNLRLTTKIKLHSELSIWSGIFCWISSRTLSLNTFMRIYKFNRGNRKKQGTQKWMKLNLSESKQSCLLTLLLFPCYCQTHLSALMRIWSLKQANLPRGTFTSTHTPQLPFTLYPSAGCDRRACQKRICSRKLWGGGTQCVR